MPGLSLDDLGITLGPEAPDEGAWLVPMTTAEPQADLTSLGEAGHVEATAHLQTLVRIAGVAQATRVLRTAITQIWGANLDAMPMSAAIVAAESDDVAAIADLEFVLGLRLPRRTAGRVLELARRHGDAFLTDHPAWSGLLADQGIGYAEMERRALLGEFDVTGPPNSRFDVEQMTFVSEPA